MTRSALAGIGLGLAFSIPAVWVWSWPASRWAAVQRHEAKYGSYFYQPFSVLITIPSAVGSVWLDFGWAALLNRVAPHILDGLSPPVGFVVLLWPLAIPISVWLSGHPASFVPPGARRRQRLPAEATLEKHQRRHIESLVERGLATGELKLEGGRSLAIVMVVLGIAMTGTALLGAIFTDPRGWWAVVFFGLATTLLGAQLIPGMVYLELTPRGFTFRQLFKTWRYQWKDVEGFAPTWAGQPMVAFRLTSAYRGRRPFRRLIRHRSGYDATVPGTYGLRAEELANLLNRWRERFS